MSLIYEKHLEQCLAQLGLCGDIIFLIILYLLLSPREPSFQEPMEHPGLSEGPISPVYQITQMWVSCTDQVLSMLKSPGPSYPTSFPQTNLSRPLTYSYSHHHWGDPGPLTSPASQAKEREARGAWERPVQKGKGCVPTEVKEWCKVCCSSWTKALLLPEVPGWQLYLWPAKSLILESAHFLAWLGSSVG